MAAVYRFRDEKNNLIEVLSGSFLQAENDVRQMCDGPVRFVGDEWALAAQRYDRIEMMGLIKSWIVVPILLLMICGAVCFLGWF